MPIKLQKCSNFLCLVAHFRLLEADKDPQSQKSCKKSEIFVFATGRSPRQERDPTKNAWTPLERAKVQTPTKQAGKTTRASKANSAESAKGTGSQQRRRDRTRETHTSQRGRQDRLSERRRARHLQRQRSRPPQKPTRPPATMAGQISRWRNTR